MDPNGTCDPPTFTSFTGSQRPTLFLFTSSICDADLLHILVVHASMPPYSTTPDQLFGVLSPSRTAGLLMSGWDCASSAFRNCIDNINHNISQPSAEHGFVSRFAANILTLHLLKSFSQICDTQKPWLNDFT